MSRSVVALLLLTPLAVRADDAALAKTAAGMFHALRTETLPNGLRVVLLPVPGSPVVTTMVAYKVGSADEEPGQTGLSHYLEHLLFKGTDKLMPGDIDRLTQRGGGANNAYTTEDMTNYHFDFAADRWPEALKIEAARMRGTRIDEKHEFEQEKGAVVAELKGGEDRPWDLDYKAILPMLFPKGSPYAHPVIGEENHVRAATAEVIKRHYDKWYHPNNAALVVAGGFDPDEALTLIKKLFGPIPKGDLPPRPAAPEVKPRTKQVRKEFESKFDVPRLTVGFNTVRAGDPDDYVLDVIDSVLTGGKTARLYKALVEGEEIANEVSSSNDAGRYPGWYSVQVELLKGKDRKTAEEIVFRELDKLATEPITDNELKRVRRGLLAGFIFSRESVHGTADLLARAVMISGPGYATTYLDRVMAVTPQDVMRVAKKHFGKDKAAVVWSVPGDEKAAGLGAVRGFAARAAKPRTASTTGPSALSLTDAKRVVLPNGLTLLMLPNRRLPVVVAEAYFADVRLREPAEKSGVAPLVGYLLEEGTTTRTGDEIARKIEDAGGSLSVTSAGGSVKVLTPDADLGLDLLFDCLANPSFPADALDRARGQLLSDIADAETQPQNRARMLFQKLVYGDHPFGRPATGKREVVEKLTAADLKAFHKSAFAPNVTTVAIVGDFDPADMAKRVERLTATWKRADLTKPAPSAPPAAAGVVKIVTDPTAAQTHVYLGQIGITRKNPDYYKLLVMDNVLGTGPGFTDRLSSTLRDRQGLAYTVTAQIAGTAGDQPGAFTGYVGTFPDKFTWVRDGFLKEVNRLRDEPPTGARGGRRQELPARPAAVQAGHVGRHRRPTAAGRAVRAGAGLPRRVPQAGGGRHPGRRAGGGEKVPRPRQVRGRRGRADQRRGEAAGAGHEREVTPV
jgi:zinc protease